ncbi:hypothetical protein FACS189413_05100 [Bacteroidia bacterium]|nr:hypothetical protein FACS189413_05100 [Bacteroidia bacterium]
MFSWETATEDGDGYLAGDMLWTISGEGAVWRNLGIQAANLQAAGISGLFQKINTNTANPQVFRPVTGITIPEGTVIKYYGTIEWTTIQEPTAYSIGRTIDNYIYGSNCSSAQPLAMPADVNLASGNLTFTGDVNAASFTVGVYNGSILLYTITNFTSGSAFSIPVNGEFNIKIMAITGSINYLNSDIQTFAIRQRRRVR